MINRQEQEEKFKKIYERLNREQKKAVDALEGAVIVNAGPGTGKTQIIATRIGNILLQTDTTPGSILCLTYTDNGAVEMRNRLLQIIGTPAYGVRIHTFHSFCNEVIQDNLSYFGKLNLEPISELEEIDLFNRLIDSIEPGNILKRFRGEVYFEAPRLKDLFGLMKKEAWTVEFMEERIRLYLSELPHKEGFYYKRKYQDFQAGDPNPGKIAAETERMEILLAAVRLYPRYNQLMAAVNRYNFDDMILWVLSAFEKNQHLLLDYQERYLYFLVDEFQDTSRSQNLLLQYLTSYWDRPNVFVVGDADQSIFSFQDANVENILEFEKKYADTITKIDLKENYRSTQIILDTAFNLIRNNNLRIGVPADAEALKAASEGIADRQVLPAIVQYPNTTQESIDIAVQIEDLRKNGISGKEIAVIYRNHAQVAQLIVILEQKGIAVNIRKKTDVLQVPFIRNILTILTWIDRENTLPETADDLLFKILHFDFFPVKPAAVSRLSMRVNEKNTGRKADRVSLRSELAELIKTNGDLFTQPDNSLKEVGEILESLLKDAFNQTVQHLVEKTIQKTGVLAFIMESAEKPWLMQVLDSFFSFIKDLCKRNPELTLHELLGNISLMQKNKITLPLYKVVSSGEGVNLVTAHGAKGSEYDYVFLLGCTNKIWDEPSSGGNRTYHYPDNLAGSYQAPSDLEESRRLFYVALTRARTNLQISYALKDKNDKPLTKSSFVTEIEESMKWKPVERAVPDEILVSYLALQFEERARPEIELVEKNYIDQLLKRYTLSVTHLSNYLYCPLKFYYQNLIRVPAAKNESLVFGSATHFALQRLFEKMREQNGVFPSVEEFTEDFKWYLNRHRDAFTPESFELKRSYGEKILPDYYQSHINSWNKVVVIEKMIRNVWVAEVPINGKLDKLEFQGNRVNVVDYKTGKYENGKKKLAPPDATEPNGGDYWRQAVFYKILMDNDKTNDWEAISTEFEFIEPVRDAYKTEKLLITREDITTVTQQIRDTWQKIQNREFNKGCGRPDCEWCSFVKTNKLSIALHDPGEEPGEDRDF